MLLAYRVDDGLWEVDGLLGVQRFVLDRIGNPVLEWELLQRRKRRGKAYVVVTRILSSLWFLFVFTSTALILFGDPVSVFDTTTEDISGTLFLTSWWFLVCTIFLVVPIFGASSVVGERRSQTLELVQLSLLRPFDIVWGKVVASVTPIVMFMFGLIAVALLSFFPGTAVYRILREPESWLVFAGHAGFLVVPVLIMAVAFTVSALSVLVSTFAKSAAVAVIVSYGMTFIFFLYLNMIIPDRYYASYYSVWPKIAVYYVVEAAVLLCAARLFVWWACKRLRLPVVSASAKSSAAGIPMSRVAVPVSLIAMLILPLAPNLSRSNSIRIANKNAWYNCVK